MKLQNPCGAGALVRVEPIAAKKFNDRSSPEPPMKKDLVHWPSKNSLSAQLVEVGVPFVRDKLYPDGTKEVVVVERKENGTLTSRCVGTVRA